MLVVVLLVVIILIIGFKLNRKPPRHEIYNEWGTRQKKRNKVEINLECPNCHHKNSSEDKYCEKCGSML